MIIQKGCCMEFVIITGMSGSGKSRAIAAMEDIGYYCVDNLAAAHGQIIHRLVPAGRG